MVKNWICQSAFLQYTSLCLHVQQNKHIDYIWQNCHCYHTNNTFLNTKARFSSASAYSTFDGWPAHTNHTQRQDGE